MKLGVSYIAFDGIELLEHSIKQIRDHVDYIQVIYQNYSWFGNRMPEADMEELVRLSKTRFVDDLTSFTNFSQLKDKSARSIVKAKSYERAKRQLGLNSCVSKGCTHYLCMDVDEFYVTEEFAKAKIYISVNNIGLSAVGFINYVNLPTLQRGTGGKAVVPFICKVTSKSKMVPSFIAPCDPTRGITKLPGLKNHRFGQHFIKMHHMETVRKNLHSKFNSTTRSLFDRSRIHELVSHIKSVEDNSKAFSFNKIIFPKTPPVPLNVVDNIFNIPYEKWKNHG